jgi:hypothetical protein
MEKKGACRTSEQLTDVLIAKKLLAKIRADYSPNCSPMLNNHIKNEPDTNFVLAWQLFHVSLCRIMVCKVRGYRKGGFKFLEKDFLERLSLGPDHG